MSRVHCDYECPICGQTENEITFYGFGQCDHPICAVCAIKLQKFSSDSEYEYSKCVICKQEITKMIISKQVDAYESFDQEKLIVSNDGRLLFNSTDAKSFYFNIIKISCPKCNKFRHQSMKDLISHLSVVHKRRYCELCMEFTKCLQSELEVYTGNDYHYHRNKLHPKCRFCDIRFYDESHLIKHVKINHFLCDICHRNHGYIAYSTQGELIRHYTKDHHVCEICRSSNNINVFDSEYSLKTHKVSAHATSLVDEGLMNVNYGDRQTKFSARRRARQKYFDNLDRVGEQQSNVVKPQAIPTIKCDQEFPHLGQEHIDTTTVPAHQQIGVQCFTVDENDSRTAFGSVPKTTTANTSNTASASDIYNHNKTQTNMSDNIAILIKKSIGGRLNPEDFPTLTSTNPTGQEQKKIDIVSTTKEALSSKRSCNALIEPLSKPMGGSSSMSRSWKDTMIKVPPPLKDATTEDQYVHSNEDFPTLTSTNPTGQEQKKIDIVSITKVALSSKRNCNALIEPLSKSIGGSSSTSRSWKDTMIKVPPPPKDATTEDQYVHRNEDFPSLGLSPLSLKHQQSAPKSSWDQHNVVPNSVFQLSSNDNGKLKRLSGNKKKQAKKTTLPNIFP